MARPLESGRQKVARNEAMPWHVHQGGYAVVVMSGNYTEAGDGGRYRVSPSHIVIHAPFHAHLNCIGDTGLEVVNVPHSLRDALQLKSSATADPESMMILPALVWFYVA